MKSGATIVVCSSANFYKHVVALAAELETLGFVAVIPHNALQMQQSGDYDPDTYKTWYNDGKDFDKKAEFMRRHFDEVAAGDAVLVVNDEKHGVAGYIGPNVLLEMGIGFYLKKPIFVLNAFDKSMSNYEEVYGMGSIMLNGDLSAIKSS